ncbi:MAG: tetratricopeptide repeat protein [bacterium]
MKNIITIMLLMLLAVPAYAGMAFFPALEVGIESNDNIDLATKEAASNTSAKAVVCLGLEGYLNPDLYCRSQLSYKGWIFSDTSYGSLGESNINLGFDHDINERLCMSLDGNIINYTDSELTGNNSQTSSMAPELIYKFTPYTALGIYGSSNHLTYTNSDEAVNEQKTEIFLSNNFTDRLSMTMSGFNIKSQNDLFDSLDFQSSGVQLNLGFDLEKIGGITLNYVPESISYPNWATSRMDQRTTAGISYLKQVSESFEVKVNYDQVQNNSDDASQTYKNNIAYIGLSWEPGFGNIYSDDIESEWGYYLSEGLAAYDREDWAYAERLFKKTAFLVDGSDDVHYYLGYCLNKQAKFNESIAELEKTIMLNPDYIEAYYALSYAYIKVGEKSKAQKILNRLLENTGDEKVKTLINKLWGK